MKDNRDIENYRPISIISMLPKIFEMCLYKRMCCKLQTDSMQYRYVKEGGCEKCIFAVTYVTNLHFTCRLLPIWNILPSTVLNTNVTKCFMHKIQNIDLSNFYKSP